MAHVRLGVFPVVVVLRQKGTPDDNPPMYVRAIQIHETILEILTEKHREPNSMRDADKLSPSFFSRYVHLHQHLARGVPASTLCNSSPTPAPDRLSP